MTRKTNEINQQILSLTKLEIKQAAWDAEFHNTIVEKLETHQYTEVRLTERRNINR